MIIHAENTKEPFCAPATATQASLDLSFRKEASKLIRKEASLDLSFRKEALHHMNMI
jgi:hypothetical protein